MQYLVLFQHDYEVQDQAGNSGPGAQTSILKHRRIMLCFIGVCTMKGGPWGLHVELSIVDLTRTQVRRLPCSTIFQLTSVQQQYF